MRLNPDREQNGIISLCAGLLVVYYAGWQVWQLVLQVCAGLICIKDQNDGYFSGRLKKGIGEYAGWESEQFDSRIVNML